MSRSRMAYIYTQGPHLQVAGFSVSKRPFQGKFLIFLCILKYHRHKRGRLCSYRFRGLVCEEHKLLQGKQMQMSYWSLAAMFRRPHDYSGVSNPQGNVRILLQCLYMRTEISVRGKKAKQQHMGMPQRVKRQKQMQKG